jgi:hypothetical protein
VLLTEGQAKKKKKQTKNKQTITKNYTNGKGDAFQRKKKQTKPT